MPLNLSLKKVTGETQKTCYNECLSQRSFQITFTATIESLNSQSIVPFSLLRGFRHFYTSLVTSDSHCLLDAATVSIEGFF